MSSPLLTCDPARAVAVLRGGGLLGLPTETVYGLAAAAADEAAVARVFAVKGRPADHPLIVHVADAAAAMAWARDVPGYARRLAERLWPGPLTLVLPRSDRAGDHVTGGQPTVGLRCPSHPVAREVLAAFGDGVAAPSANRFGRVSPTSPAHVLAELGEALDPVRDAVLDGGPCRVGVESTIVDCTGPSPRVLRPGSVTLEQLADAGGVEVAVGAAAGASVRVPGALAVHYAPRARVRLLDPDEVAGASDAGGAGAIISAGRGLIAPRGVATPAGLHRLAAPDDAAAYARELYAALRRADDLGMSEVLVVPPPAGGIGTAIRDRLRRAAAAGRDS